MVVIICGKYGNNRSRTGNVTERTRFSKSRSNGLEDISQGQRSSHATHLLMLVIICTKYGKNPSRTVDATERTRFSKSRSNDLEDIGQIQRSHITCDTPSHASDHLYQIWKESIKNCRCYRADTIFKVKVEWPWRYRSNSKVITCDTPSHASDHLYQIWKESIKNCRCYRADTIFKAKAKWPWRYRSRSKVIICNTLSHTSDHLYQIWKESIENCRFFFSRSRPKIFKNLLKIQIFRFWKKRNTRHTP